MTNNMHSVRTIKVRDLTAVYRINDKLYPLQIHSTTRYIALNNYTGSVATICTVAK